MSEKTTVTFRQWLRSQRDRHDPIGDLARDARDDRCFPRSTEDYWRYWRHMSFDHAACEAAEEAFDQAWIESGRELPIDESGWIRVMEAER